MPASSTGHDDHWGVVDVQPESDEIVALALDGEFDMANVAVLAQRIEKTLERNYHLILDLSQATFIDSSVIHAFVRASKTAETRERTVVLQLGIAEIGERLIDVTRIERVLPRAHTRADAVRMIEHSLANRGTRHDVTAV